MELWKYGISLSRTTLLLQPSLCLVESSQVSTVIASFKCSTVYAKTNYWNNANYVSSIRRLSSLYCVCKFTMLFSKMFYWHSFSNMSGFGGFYFGDCMTSIIHRTLQALSSHYTIPAYMKRSHHIKELSSTITNQTTSGKGPTTTDQMAAEKTILQRKRIPNGSICLINFTINLFCTHFDNSTVFKEYVIKIISYCCKSLL